MGTAIIVVGVAGFLLLFAATAALVVLNWSEKTLAPVLSILLVGTATTLAAVLVTLKKSTIESAFPTTVVLDTSDGAPVFVIPDPASPDLTSRLSELVSLGRPVVNRDGKTISTIAKPTTESERFTFVGELLQYQLVRTIEDLQRGGWTAGLTLGASVATVDTAMTLADGESLSNQAVLSAVASNRFSNSDMEKFHWEHGRFPLPQNARLSLVHLPTSPSTGTEKHIVRLEKPMFFRIDFIVEPLLSTSLGALPKGLVLDPHVATRCETYHFQVTMRATFEKITAGNSRSEEYKEWAPQLYSGIKEKLGD